MMNYFLLFFSHMYHVLKIIDKNPNSLYFLFSPIHNVLMMPVVIKTSHILTVPEGPTKNWHVVLDREYLDVAHIRWAFRLLR